MLTATDVANELELSKTRVLSLITSGRLKATKLGPLYVIDPKDLETFKLQRSPHPDRGPQPVLDSYFA